MSRLHPHEGPRFWTDFYAPRIPLYPPKRQAVMRRVLAENVGESRGR